jgi:hypothetical protein
LALYQIELAPFQYASARLRGATSLLDRLTFPGGWFAAQMLNTAPAICLSLALLFLFRGRLSSLSSPMFQFENPRTRQDLQFVAILFAAPILLALAIQALGGVRFRDMWGFPFFVLFGPVIALLTAARPSHRDVLPKLAIAGTAMLALAVTALVAVDVGSPYVIKKRGPRFLFPAQELASQVGSQWAFLFDGKPLRYVVSDPWLGGMFAAYHADHPSVLLSGDFKQSPWVKPDVIGEEGGILVWNNERDGEKLTRAFPKAIRQPSLQLAFHTKAAIPAARVDWAILPPSSAKPTLASRSELSAFR